MDAQNTSTPNVNDVSRLLTFQYKLATALLNRSIDSFTSFEKKICSLSLELTQTKNMHESITFFLCGFFAEDTENYLRNKQEISYQDFDNNFEAIDDLVFAVGGEVMKNHQNRIYMIKQEATKHDF
jgi:hypothetical protein